MNMYQKKDLEISSLDHERRQETYSVTDARLAGMELPVPNWLSFSVWRLMFALIEESTSESTFSNFWEFRFKPNQIVEVLFYASNYRYDNYNSFT